MKPLCDRKRLRLRSEHYLAKPAADDLTLPVDAVMRLNTSRPYFNRFAYEPAPNGAVFDGFKWRQY